MRNFKHISKDEEVLEFVKEKYLTPDEQGGHKYSLRDICAAVRQKFDKSLTPQTILNWARKYGWDKLWEQAVKEGITRAVKTDKSKTLEEQYREAIAKKKEQDFILATNLKALGYKYIQQVGFSSTMEALKAIEMGLKYTQDLEDKSNEQVIKIEFVGHEDEDADQ
jgi:6-phosphofructokinase